MLDQVVVCSANVGVTVACHRAVHIVKDGGFVTVQVVFIKPLSRLSKECTKMYLRSLFVLLTER